MRGIHAAYEGCRSKWREHKQIMPFFLDVGFWFGIRLYVVCGTIHSTTNVIMLIAIFEVIRHVNWNARISMFHVAEMSVRIYRLDDTGAEYDTHETHTQHTHFIICFPLLPLHGPPSTFWYPLSSILMKRLTICGLCVSAWISSTTTTTTIKYSLRETTRAVEINMLFRFF